MMRVLKLPVVLVALTVTLGGMLYEGNTTMAMGETLFDDVNIGLFSIGGRATYFDTKEGDDNWFGGGQVRIHPFHFLAVEGSVDYRRTDINATKVRTFPVQGSVLLYPFGTKRLSPFILGGAGWYFTNVEGPGDFDKTQHRFGAHAGGGLQLFLTEYVSLDGTYRHIWLEKIESQDASLRGKRFEDNGHMVTFGLNVHF
ncbi:MAG: porin family protein [Nitrospira sp.]|nr:porin family protein [Nitrospira sp.]MDH4245905.1 porin family protein [Nitrospira sp.]MDH4356046.1 porin family protein [Nitrospira sp.]MDH5320581.1 porin family protein [Nitrospira sp.]